MLLLNTDLSFTLFFLDIQLTYLLILPKVVYRFVALKLLGGVILVSFESGLVVGLVLLLSLFVSA